MSFQPTKEEQKTKATKTAFPAVPSTVYVLVATEGKIAGQFYNNQLGQPVPSLNLATFFGSERDALSARAPVGQKYQPYPVSVAPGEENPERRALRGVPREGTYFGALKVGEIFEDLSGGLCVKTFPVYSNHGIGPAAAFNAIILHPAEDAPPEVDVTSAPPDQDKEITIRVPVKRGFPLYFRDNTFVDRADITGFQYESTRKFRAKAQQAQ